MFLFLSDLVLILQWWFVLFLLGILFLPLSQLLFHRFFDKGYIFVKILGIAIVSYLVFLFGILHILAFTQVTILIALLISSAILWLVIKKTGTSVKELFTKHFRLFLFEELLFLLALIAWSIIRGFQPNIHGLEKFMDFGFVNSILRSEYFPPDDMWFALFPINYYYFGHLITAVITKLSGMNPAVTYNLMLATLFAFTFTGSFSLGANFLHQFFTSQNDTHSRHSGKQNKTKRTQNHHQTKRFWILQFGGHLACRQTGARKNDMIRIFGGGLLSAFLVSLGGNLHTLYSLFKAYQNESPVPLWQLAFSPSSFPNSYWYPNATRFIQNTIHEFPLYSFVVSDLHGHVLDIPFVLLCIATLFHTFLTKTLSTVKILFISFLLAIMYMTNAWDGIIYFLLALFVIASIQWQQTKEVLNPRLTPFLTTILLIIMVGLGAVVFTLPFSFFFKPFVSGIGVLCAPEFLIKLAKVGPFLFEADRCLRSPVWQLVTLYGFFYCWVVIFFVLLWKKTQFVFKKLSGVDIFISVLILLSTILILIPEFVYAKDIYPAHYRANTMFKLVYEAFIMLSLVSGYVIFRLVERSMYHVISIKDKVLRLCFILLATCFLLPIFVYPYFAVSAYYNNLKQYNGLDGMAYLKNQLPDDYDAILWINRTITGQPILLEAPGDSYTDYERISANTGLPTIIGWGVHEWLWRGTYDVVKPRVDDVQAIYESTDVQKTKKLLRDYHVKYVYIGGLERQKYPTLAEEKFKQLGDIVYQKNQTVIYKLSL